MIAPPREASELEAHLLECGCQKLREGANHAIWANPERDLRAPMPRHREIPTGTARAICRQLGIPPPAGSR
ncbi:MAG: type II toxin-antitoxin system HicA family toxin [Acetobacteraceae bacterium]|nr:type II toxin-antitoxin system HicA family toxin [Acetobacteraceae bacterium]